MGRGREVAEAFIDVHGDLSNFRKDLEGANADMEAMALETADTFSDAWGERMAKQLDKQWNSVIDSVFSGSDADISKMIGTFDSTDLDAATEKIHLLLRDMREAGKMTGEEYDTVMGKIEDVAKAQRQAFFQEQDDMAERTRSMFELAQIQERYAKSFEKMTRDNKLDALTADFKAMAKAASDMNWTKMAAGFDSMEDFRDRIAEVNSEMLLLGRISEDNAKQISSDVDAWIAQEQERKRVILDTAAAAEQALKDEKALKEQNRQLTREATAEAIKAAKELRDEQDRYNKSLDGMTKLAKIRFIERDYRLLTDAIASSDWSEIAKGSRNINEMRDNVTRVTTEMRRMGRITEDEFTRIGHHLTQATTDARRFRIEFKTMTDDGRRDSDALGKSIRGFGTFLTNAGNATRGLREHLQSFAGLNVFGDMIRSGLNFIHNMDRIALSSAQTALQLGVMGAAGGSALAGMAVIAEDIVASLAGITAVLPAFLVGAGIGMGVLVASFKDLKTVLKDLGPQFSRLQDSISAKFWEQAEKPIRDLTTKLFPTLQKQLDITATRMGALTGAFATAFADAATPERVTGMFERMNSALDIAKGAVGPLVRAFVNLGEVGSKYFERFGKWTVKLSEQFEAFIQKAFDTGQIDQWIETGIEGFKDMGRALDGMIGIFNAIDSAARAAGSGGLDAFANKLQAAAAAMQSPKFQTAMTQLFSGMNSAVESIGAALRDLGPSLAEFMPFAERAFADIGTAAATVIGYIGQVLENPQFQHAILVFTGSMIEALDKLAPAVEPFTNSLGQAIELLGKILVNTAEVASAFIVNVGPVLDSMSAKMATLLDPLKDMVIEVIQQLTPALDKLDKEVIGPMVEGIRTNLIPAIEDAVGKIAPLVEAVVTSIAPALKELAETILPAVVSIAGNLAPFVETIVKLATPLIKEWFETVGAGLKDMAAGMGDFTTKAGPFLERVQEIADKAAQIKIPKNLENGDGVNPWVALVLKYDAALLENSPKARSLALFFNPYLSGLTDAWMGLVNGIQTLLSPEKLSLVLAKAVGGITAAFVSVGAPGGLNDTVNKWFDDTFFKPVREGWDNAFKALGEWWAGVKQGFQEWMSSLLGFDAIFNSDDASVTGGGGAGGRGMGIGGKIEEAWQMEDMSFMDRFKEAVRIKWEEFWTGVQTQLASWGESIKTNWDLFWTGLGAKIAEVWDAAVLWIQTKATEIATNITTWAAQVKAGWDGFWSDVSAKVTEIWNAITTWIATKAGEIKTNVENFIRDTKANWDAFWAGVGAKVTEIWNSITSWIGTKIGEIRGNIDRFIGDVKNGWNNFWAEVGRKVDEAWNGIKSGVETGIQNVLTFFRNLPQDIINAIGNIFSKMSQVGSDIVNGMKAGIDAGIEWVRNAAANVADAAVKAAKAVLDSNSPSKVFDRIGRDVDRGFVDGVRAEQHLVAGAAASMADKAISAVTGYLAQSQMYRAGAEAALGLADGLTSNKAQVMDAFSNLLPSDVTASVGTVGFGGVGGSTPGKTTIINIAEGAIPINTPTENPGIVATKVIDGFAAASNF